MRIYHIFFIDNRTVKNRVHNTSQQKYEFEILLGL